MRGEDRNPCLPPIPSVLHRRDATASSGAGGIGDLWSPFSRQLLANRARDGRGKHASKTEGKDTWMLGTRALSPICPSVCLTSRQWLLSPGKLAGGTPSSQALPPPLEPSTRAPAGDARGKGIHFHPFPLGKLEQKGATLAPESRLPVMATGRAARPARGCVHHMHTPSPTPGSMSDSPPPATASPACLYGRFESWYLQLFLYLGLI